MYRVLRRLAIGTGLMLLGAATVLAILYRAATAPVPEYQALVEKTRERIESGQTEQATQELESQLSALYSEAQREETWQTIITSDQMNAWLATRVPQDFPEIAEQGIFEPQVLMKPGVATLAMRANIRGIKAVVAIDIEPFVAEDGSLALELAGARIGSATMPLAQILDHLDQTMGEEGLPGRWARNDGNPVLLFDFEPLASSIDHIRTLQGIEVHDGELRVAGLTRQRTARVASRDPLAIGE